eukprot:194065_1
MSMASVDLNNNTPKQSANEKDSAPLLTTKDEETTKKSLWGRKQIFITFFALIIVLIVVIIVIVIEEESESSSPSIKEDILYIYHDEGRIYTMDQNTESNTVEAICIDTSDGIFISVGDGDDVLNNCTAFADDNNHGLRKLYFNDSLASNITILPGLIDSHAHIMSLGANFFRADLSTASSIDEVLNSIANFISNYSIGP